LLHGDLWSGNAGFTGEGPVVFDPAVYYGDREADLAMTELFGGFPREFYDAYRKEWPVDDGYVRRKHLYNLYHLLNHLNLFGGGYLGQVKSTLRLLGL
jgi:fructosamine-3-kinase